MSPKTYEVVISGISGIFPECDNVEELEHKLMNKDNMISTDNRKWPTGLLNVPAATGKFKKNITLDYNFFGISHKLYEIMDPTTVQSLKNAFEAICDAGVNPFDLNGSNTAVIKSNFISETEYFYIASDQKYGLLGQSRCMQTNRVSYFLNFKGPSFNIDVSWNGGLQCLQLAHELIASGECTAALVGVNSLLFGPEISYHFQAMGRLNNDGKTKCFSADADGYNRSEASVAFFLQRAEDAKRSYGTILGTHTLDYGTRNTSFTDMSEEKYKAMLEDAYKKVKVNPSEVSYVEAYGAASKVMDAVELNCIAEVMCANRPHPLPVGSVKSNVGHTEAASSLVSVIKVLIALKTGIIPPNLHYSSANPDVPALLSGQLEVVTEPTPLNGNIVGVSSLGLSGTYGHIIIKGNTKKKPHVSSINLPWLFLVSGRTENDLKNVIEKVESLPFNEEFMRLCNNVFKTPMKKYTYRGYTLLNAGDEHPDKEIKSYDGDKRPIWFVFSGMGSQWAGMGAELMRLPTFAKAINLCHNVLLPKGIDLLSIINSKDPHIYDLILHSFIGIAAIQIGLVDVLKELGIEPDGIVGHSVGELGCAYADGCFTAEQTILAAYARGKASTDPTLIKGMMAAVGMGYNQIKDQLPPSIDVACHNSSKSCTLSGPAIDMDQYIAGFKDKGIFAKLVNVSDIAYHSRYIKPVAPLLLQYLKEVIPEPKQRSKRWISSSVPKSSWDSDLAKYSSAEYHTNNLLSPVLFEEATAHIPERAIVIEIAPHGLLQSIVKQSLNSCTNIALVNKFASDTLVHLFKAIGKLYLKGIAVDIENLFPKIEYPITGGIPSITSLLTWDNKEGLGKLKYKYEESSLRTINISSKEDKYFGHKINGKQIISSTALLWTAVEIFKKQNVKPLLIENIYFEKEIEISNNLDSEIEIQVQKCSGNFEVNLNSTTLLNGRISFILPYRKTEWKSEENYNQQSQLDMNHDEIYKYFAELSIEFKDSFKLIQKVSMNENDIMAVVLWRGEWMEFLDALLMVVSLYDTINCNKFKIVHYVRQICIDCISFQYFKSKAITVFYNKHTKELSGEGINISMPLTRFCDIMPSVPDLLINDCKFLQYYCQNNDQYGQLDECLQLLLQNTLGYRQDSYGKLKILFEEDANSYSELCKIFQRQSDVRKQIVVVTTSSEDMVDDVYLNLTNNDHLMVIGEISYYKKLLKCLEKVKAGFLLLKSQENIEKCNLIYPVFQFKFHDTFYTLFKMFYQNNIPRNIISIKDKNWKMHLKLFLKNNILKENSLELIYLVGRLKSLSKIYNITRYCQQQENSHFIRFIFYDDQSPPFSLDEPFYKEQIIKDLVINICINNTWGCLKLFTPHTLSIRPLIMDQQQLVYPLSSIKGEKVKLAYLGLNLTDEGVHSQGPELEIFEYCGTDKAGKTVCGIGSLTDNRQLVEEEILCWQKPPEWSNEEAASIPLSYALAYYILRESDAYKLWNRTLLVHYGIKPISQAIINVALSLNYEIFTTVKTDEEKHHLHQLFPQISKDNVFYCGGRSFDILILTKSKLVGVDMIINTSNDYSVLKSSLKCLTANGIYVQLHPEAMNKECILGMSEFLRNNSFYSVPAKLLLDLPSSDKQILHKEIDNGIKNGNVKPLQISCLPATSLNSNAIAILKNNENGDNKKIIYKCVNNEDVNINNTLFICSPEKSYIIISDGNSFIIDLINWLINRGAKTIHVLTEQRLDHSTSLRLEGIKKKHSSIKVYLNADINANIRNNIRKYLEEVNAANLISEIFITGKDMEYEIDIIDSVLREMNLPCGMICIGSGGEEVCETRSAINLPALAVSCQRYHIKAEVILPLLDRFTENLKKSSVIFLEEETTDRNSNKDGRSLERIPKDVNELLILNKKSISKACFVEVMTSCPQYKYNKEVSPIFVIPGLKPNQMDKLTSRLFYPTFEARLPQDIDDIESVAKQLHEDIKRFKFKIFTLITNDWGGALGLELAKYLEDNGKIVLLVMLNSSPQTVQNWTEEVLKLGDVNLISKYVKIPHKQKKQLLQLSDWEEKVSITLDNSIEDEIEREGIRNGLNILKNSLLAIMKYKANGEKFQGKYFIYIPGGSSENDHCSIEEFCKRKPIINISTENSHQDMLDDPEMARIINALIPYEYKTAAHDINYEIFGDYLSEGQRVR